MLVTNCWTLCRKCSLIGQLHSRILLGGRQIPFQTEPNQQVAVFSPRRFTASFESFCISENCFGRLICSVRFAHNITYCGVGNWLKVSSKQNWIFGTSLHVIDNALVSLQFIWRYVCLSLSLCLSVGFKWTLICRAVPWLSYIAPGEHMRTVGRLLSMCRVI